MNTKVSSWILYLVLGVAVAFVATCGGGGGSGSGDQSGTGSVTVMLHVTKDSGATLAQIQCSAADTVEASIYDETNTRIASGGPWECDDHQGTISNVPAGCGRTIVVRAEITVGTTEPITYTYLGEVTDFCVIADQDNNATVELEIFETPWGLYSNIGECSESDCSVELNWYGGWSRNIVQLTLLDDPDFTSPLIDEFVAGRLFPNTYEAILASPESYRWRVIASDSVRSTQLISEEDTFSLGAF